MLMSTRICLCQLSESALWAAFCCLGKIVGLSGAKHFRALFSFLIVFVIVREGGKNSSKMTKSHGEAGLDG